jgi:chromosome segregation ATPase
MNHEKMIEIYKTKIIQKPVAKTEDDSSNDESKRLQLINNQMKNLLEIAKKDLTKYQERLALDSTAMNVLKVDKAKLEQQLKKATHDSKKEVLANSSNQQQDQDMKKLQLQHDFLDSQLKQKIMIQKELEVKLQDALKNQKKDIVTDETSTKGKTAHLENNVRKLTQDLVENRNQLGEMKKETNKLRQDKIALQNQFDKMKKDLDKAKGAAPQKPGSSGQAA